MENVKKTSRLKSISFCPPLSEEQLDALCAQIDNLQPSSVPREESVRRQLAAIRKAIARGVSREQINGLLGKMQLYVSAGQFSELRRPEASQATPKRMTGRRRKPMVTTNEPSTPVVSSDDDAAHLRIGGASKFPVDKLLSRRAS